MSTARKPPDINTLSRRIANLEHDVISLREQLDARSSGRIPGVCRKGNDPATCPVASTFHYQHLCGGARCSEVNNAYYSGRNRKKTVPAKNGVKPTNVPVAAPRRKILKRVNPTR